MGEFVCSYMFIKKIDQFFVLIHINYKSHEHFQRKILISELYECFSKVWYKAKYNYIEDNQVLEPNKQIYIFKRLSQCKPLKKHFFHLYVCTLLPSEHRLHNLNSYQESWVMASLCISLFFTVFNIESLEQSHIIS